MNISKKNYKNVPKKWFFFNPTNNSHDKYFFKISNKTGIIFFYEEKKKKKKSFLEKIKPYILWCQNKGINFFIQSSIYWANKYKASGVFFDQKNFLINNKLNFSYINKKFLIAGKIHNFKEARNFSKFLNLVFISNVFETKTYPMKKALNF